MDQVELINVVTASVAQVTHRRIAYVHPTEDFTAVVGVEGGTSAQEKANISVLLPEHVVIEICEAGDEAEPPT